MNPLQLHMGCTYMSDCGNDVQYGKWCMYVELLCEDVTINLLSRLLDKYRTMKLNLVCLSASRRLRRNSAPA